MGSCDLDFGSALEAAEFIRNKQISSVELTQRMYERLDRFNPALNAFVYELREEALSLAKKADEALARGESLGVFHGVPISIFDGVCSIFSPHREHVADTANEVNKFHCMR